MNNKLENTGIELLNNDELQNLNGGICVLSAEENEAMGLQGWSHCCNSTPTNPTTPTEK